ncbi:hypothetical protein J2Z32_001010 [Paenibacillus turicensis]|uniref:Uncharacterized protein n=1 Tax=Paenibacillus turicensis TaxID=160487 RepID=A0ABS4FPX1_9BACL|nr:hypothetical protein [Paenibacillus turicensis]
MKFLRRSKKRSTIHLKKDPVGDQRHQSKLSDQILASHASDPNELTEKATLTGTVDEKINYLYRLLMHISHMLEQSRIMEYTELLHRPWRLIWLNLLSGTSRGVGIAIGFTFFAATIVYVLQLLGALNLPIIGDYIADIVTIVQHQLQYK